MQQQEKPKNPNSCVIALGANLPSTVGGEIQAFGCAIHQMISFGLLVKSVSRFFSTPSYPNPSDPPFVNAVILAHTSHDARRVINILHEIESKLQRKRDVRWAARTLDLDLLDFEGEILPDARTYHRWRRLSVEEQQRLSPDELILPHPRMHERAFVLEPMCDILDTWEHPVLGLQAGAMRAILPIQLFDGILPLKGLQ